MILLVKINPECPLDDDAIIAELESFEALVFERCKASGYIRYKKERDFFYAIGWIIKIFVATSFQIFIVSTYHNLTAIFRRIPFDTLMYEKAADWGHYVDEYTVLRELALNIGRVLMMIITAILVYFFGITAAFVLAAIMSLFINILE